MTVKEAYEALSEQVEIKQKGLPASEKEVSLLQEKMEQLRRIAMAEGDRELTDHELLNYI